MILQEAIGIFIYHGDYFKYIRIYQYIIPHILNKYIFVDHPSINLVETLFNGSYKILLKVRTIEHLP